jgi:hypothetical protein
LLTRIGRSALGGIVAAGMLSALPAAALAAQPSCGDTLTSNTTLTADLDCSAYNGNALTMGKNKVVLDLNGHTIWGPLGADTASGVNTNGYNKTVVKNGTIANVYVGVYVYGSNQTLVKNVEVYGETADSGPAGIEVQYGAGNEIKNVRVHDTSYGILLDYTANTHILNSEVWGTDYGITTYYDSRARIQGNLVHGSSYAFWDQHGGGNRFIGNVSRDNLSEGFYIDCDGTGKVILKNNVAKDNFEDGFLINQCSDNGSWIPGSGSVFSGNLAEGNGKDGFDDYVSYNSVWTNNVARNNGENGFNIDGPGGYTMTYNVANRNGADGFYFSENYGSGNYNLFKFSHNKANNNDSWGYDADYGVPSKANKAKGNGSGNCYNVRCN